VTVNDITAGQESRLELVVDDVESPTLLRKTRVTGTVNPTGELPPPQRITSGLITGMDPTAGEQGETLDVVLTGDSSGPWPVHFAAGVSAAQFGQGIQVDSVDVASPTSLTAHIRIAGDAAPGARVVQVQTGAETAVCAPVFLVTPGRAHLTGLVTDPESGEPLVGALVSVQGTNISAVTDSEGRYTLRDLPPGRLRLVVNAPNHELFAFEADARVGETVDVGPVQPRTLVFDPNTPPGVSLFSVIAREATPYKSNRDLDDLRQMIIDTMLLLSDGEVGVLDAYGNQLNAGVEGRGAMSLNDEGIDRIARMLQSGKTYTLVQLVQGVSLGFEWGGDGEIMTWPEWREALQTMVDTAWEDPGNPENYPILVTFNQGNQFLFEPPVISEATRLNFFQAFLFTSSLFGSMETPGEKDIGGVKYSNYNKYWRGFYGVRSSWPLLKVNEIAARYLFAVGFAQTIAVATPGILGALTGTIVLGSMVPDLALAISTAGSLIQVPEPPRIVGAGKNVLGEVGVTFKRSQTEISDPDAAANFS
jgi:hypothetical protein